MKRGIFCLIALALFLMSSCGSATTAQNTYAAEMQPAVDGLAKWQGDFTNLDTLLTEPLDPNTGMTRLQMIDLYNMAMDYKITRNDYAKLGLMPLDALVGPAAKVSKDGKSILETLSAVTPPKDLQSDHQVILDCLKTRIAFADELSSSIKDLKAIDMNKAGDLIACDPFDKALQKLTAFVNENK